MNIMARSTVNQKVLRVILAITVILLINNIFGVLEFLTFSNIRIGRQTSVYDLLSLDQTDERLAQYIRQFHLFRPSTKPYNLTQGGSHSNQYSEFVLKLFQNKKDGVFIEVGAYDGEFVSNSLDLEEKGWSGLLIECNPQMLPQLMTKNRKAWISDVCLSPLPTPKILEFQTLVDFPQSGRLERELTAEEMKRFSLDKLKNKTWLHYEIPSFPLYSIIKATTAFDSIDFLSLDVEGVELKILKHFPFDKMTIKVIIVEVHFYNDQEKREMEAFLSSKGYYMVKDLGYDYVFTRQDL